MATRSMIPEFDGGDGANNESIGATGEGQEGASATGERNDREGDNSNGEESNSSTEEYIGSWPQIQNAKPTLEEELKSAAAHWILKIKETCKLTQSSMDEIIQGVTDFNSIILSKLYDTVKNALEDQNIDINDIPQVAKAFDIQSPFFRPFRGVETHYQQLQYYKDLL